MADLASLQELVAGRVILPDAADYDAARSVWNAMIDKRPAAVVRCTGTADVATSVRFAREQGVDIAVRGGGHNVAGSAVNDGGLVIDLGSMRAVLVDPAGRRAFAQGGATLADFDRETQQFGLAATQGAVSMTGVAGLTLGGGLGWLMRKHGLACDNLVGAEVVTAAGDVISASAQSHPDLLWALRGGGGNFGVVTRLDFQLFPVGPLVYGGLVLFRADHAGDVIPAYRQFVESAPADLGLNCLMLCAPPLPFIPADLHFQPVVAVGACWTGEVAEGDRVLAPIKAMGPDLDLLGPIPYCALQQMFDAGFPAGGRSYWKAGYLGSLTDDAIATIIDGAGRLSPRSIVECQPLGGAIPRGAEGSAFGNRDAAFLYNIVSYWEDAADDAAQIATTRDFFTRMEQHATGGVYVNYLSSDEGDRVRASYGDDRYRRLQAVKATYDPDNVFHGNQNIRPATA